MNFRKFSTIFSVIAIIFLTLSGTILAFDYWNKNDIDITPGNTNDPTTSEQPITGKDSPFNILLLGSEDKKGYTDIIIVANYNPQSNIVSLLSIPGNIKADVPDENGIRKLRSSYKSNGAEHTADLLTNMFNIKFKYYLYFDYSAIREVVNSLDGINYDLHADLISDVESSV